MGNENDLTSLVEKLKSKGFEPVEVHGVDAPSLNLFGIDQTKDVVIFVCTGISKAVNKESFLDPDLGVKAFNAIMGINEVMQELNDEITLEELGELKQTAMDHIEFTDETKAAAEDLAEDLVVLVVVAFSSVFKYLKAKNGGSNSGN